MSSLVGGPGSDWETSEAEEQQTGAVHSSASACWGQLTHAGTKSDTSTVQSYREVRLLQKPACPPLHVSPVSYAGSQVAWQSVPREHALVHKDKRDIQPQTYTPGYTAGRAAHKHNQRKRGSRTKPSLSQTESVSHSPIRPLSWPHVLTTCIDHICWPEVLLAWGSQTVLPHWNGLADSRPNSLLWCCPARLPSCLEHCRCHLTSGHWECVVKGDDTSQRADPQLLKINLNCSQ